MDLTKSIEDMVRDGVVTTSDKVVYKTLFVGSSFYVYRAVRVTGDGVGYRGHKYLQDGYVLAWADLCGDSMVLVPQFVAATESK